MQSCGLFFEIVPPNKFSTVESREKFLKAVSSATASIKDIGFLNIPEVADENHLGQAYFKNEDVCVFAEKARKATGIEAIANKMVVHFRTENEFTAWLDQAVNQYKIRDFVFVGGYRGTNDYLGPSVVEATRLALARHDIRVGHICIPSREGEAERMLHKTLAGGNFFTTQVLFSADPLKAVLEAYASKCQANGIKPAEVYLSFAPVQTPQDLDFLQWLGAEIPDADAQALFVDPAKTVQRSIELAKAAWNETCAFLEQNGLKIPLGLNIEAIFQHNLGHARDLAHQFAVLTAKTRP